MQGIHGISEILKKRREICMTITLFPSLRDPQGSQNRREKNTALFNSAHCIEWWMSQGLFYNDLLSRKNRGSGRDIFSQEFIVQQNGLFCRNISFCSIFFLAVPFGFILELPSSILCFALREVNSSATCCSQTSPEEGCCNCNHC